MLPVAVPSASMKTNLTAREAAVIVPVFRTPDGELRLVLIRRSPQGVHGGQIGFPGGMREDGDQTLLDTALRELWEEMAVPSVEIKILDSLPPMRTLTTDCMVSPFLGLMLNPGRWKPAAVEIDEVLEMAVEHLAKPEALDHGMESFATWPAPRRVPFFRVGPYRVWGLTHRILEPLLPRLLAGQWTI
jgi:8-oxo-dGTP pyrophosphatase MutT (NUDIX family)